MNIVLLLPGDHDQTLQGEQMQHERLAVMNGDVKGERGGAGRGGVQREGRLTGWFRHAALRIQGPQSGPACQLGWSREACTQPLQPGRQLGQ